MQRRSFLGVIIAGCAAPAIVKAGVLMPVVKVWTSSFHGEIDGTLAVKGSLIYTTHSDAEEDLLKSFSEGWILGRTRYSVGEPRAPYYGRALPLVAHKPMDVGLRERLVRGLDVGVQRTYAEYIHSGLDVPNEIERQLVNLGAAKAQLEASGELGKYEFKTYGATRSL
jgi:hypothetical protein